MKLIMRMRVLHIQSSLDRKELSYQMSIQSANHNDGAMLIQMKQIANQSNKAISNHLIRPYAIITFFHQAVIIAFEDLNEHVQDWINTKDPLIPSKLNDTFEIIACAIDIHTEHKLNGLYLEIESSLKTQLRDNVDEYTLSQADSALLQIQSFTKEHNKNTESIGQITDLICTFRELVDENQDNLDDS
eukprot:899363_1